MRAAPPPAKERPHTEHVRLASRCNDGTHLMKDTAKGVKLKGWMEMRTDVTSVS
jgi:hypothetical protein